MVWKVLSRTYLCLRVGSKMSGFTSLLIWDVVTAGSSGSGAIWASEITKNSRTAFHKKTFCITQCQGENLWEHWATSDRTFPASASTAKPSEEVRGFCVLQWPWYCEEGRETVPFLGFGSPVGCLGQISLKTPLVWTAVLRRQGARACVWQGAGLRVVWTSLSLLAG